MLSAQESSVIDPEILIMTTVTVKSRESCHHSICVIRPVSLRQPRGPGEVILYLCHSDEH